MTSIKVWRNEPLSIYSGVFDGVDKTNCTVYVPKGSLSAYRSAEVWKEFVNIVEFGEDEPDANKYDVNGDGVVDVADITALAKYILTSSTNIVGEDDSEAKKYDVNGDGFVDVADITALAKYILTNAKEEVDFEW